MKECKRLVWGLLWILTGFVTSEAQSEFLQLNLLLEDQEQFEWTKNFPVWLAEDIPAQILVGKIEQENTLVGMIYVKGLEEQLILHGMISDESMVLYEWYEDSFETGKLELDILDERINGYWFNTTGERRFSISPRSDSSLSPSTIRQYQSHDDFIFTLKTDTTESLLYASGSETEAWNDRQSTVRDCFSTGRSDRGNQYCLAGEVQLYDYYKVNVEYLIHGKVPQIPHDQKFNSHISDHLTKWEDAIAQGDVEDVEHRRWSKNQRIWFDPDWIADDIISGLLSVQYSGEEVLHSHAVIYDKNQRKFYSTEDFFKTNAPWSKNFQEKSRALLYEKHKDVIDTFPEEFDKLRFHLTIATDGILISSDFNPYFGRLMYPLQEDELKDQIQRFSPLRKYLNMK